GNLRLWQKRFWEYTIRDEADFAWHFDYLHFNPVKHGYVGQISDWGFSTFHRYVKQDIYPHNWGGGNADFSIGYD
ncbi:TPA: transposase, partial [Neisseria meningitidis]